MLGEGGIFNGGDVLYPDDPMKAKGFNIFSRQHFDKRNSQEAVKSITDIRDALRDGSARVFSDSPGLDTTLTETLTELSPLVATMNLDKIHELWVDEVTAARNLISNGQITPAQADKYLEFIRKNIEVGFPGLNLGLPAPDSTPEPEQGQQQGGQSSGGAGAPSVKDAATAVAKELLGGRNSSEESTRSKRSAEQLGAIKNAAIKIGIQMANIPQMVDFFGDRKMKVGRGGVTDFGSYAPGTKGGKYNKPMDDAISLDERDFRVKFNKLSDEEKETVRSIAEETGFSEEAALALFERSVKDFEGK